MNKRKGNIMKAKKMFRTIDTHTCGEPTRTVIGGIPPIPGKTMEEKNGIYVRKRRLEP